MRRNEASSHLSNGSRDSLDFLDGELNPLELVGNASDSSARLMEDEERVANYSATREGWDHVRTVVN